MLRWLLQALGGLPLRSAQRLGGLVGRIAWALDRKLRRITLTNLALCLPELDAAERVRIGRQSLIESARMLAELGPIWSRGRDRFEAWIAGIDGAELLERMVAQSGGLIVLVPHLGNWEIVSPFFASRRRSTILYRPPRLPALAPLMIEGRGRMGVAMAPTDSGGVRRLLRALHRGEAVGILPDQDPGDRGAVFAPFFGVPASTMTLVARLARRTDAACVVVAAVRLADGRFRLVVRAADPEIADADPECAARALNRSLEPVIRDYPEQYQWSYKRFKRRPAGLERVY